MALNISYGEYLKTKDATITPHGAPTHYLRDHWLHFAANSSAQTAGAWFDAGHPTRGEPTPMSSEPIGQL